MPRGAAISGIGVRVYGLTAAAPYGGSVPCGRPANRFALAGSPKDSVGVKSAARPCTALSAQSQPSARARAPGHPSNLTDETARSTAGPRPTATRTLHPNAVMTSGSCGPPSTPMHSEPLVSDSSSSEAACSRRRIRAESFHERRLLRARDKWLSRRPWVIAPRQIGPRRHSTFASAVVCYIAARWLLPRSMCLGNGATFSSWSALARARSPDWCLLLSPSI